MAEVREEEGRSMTQGSCLSLPDEMWLEIISRLPFKNIQACQSVCKSWRLIIKELKIKKIRMQLVSLPLCGLILFPYGYDFDMPLMNQPYQYVYVSLKTKEVVTFPTETPLTYTVVTSGYDKGLLADLSFDITVATKGGNFALHRGLILDLNVEENTYNVHNPVTKEVFVVPKSRNMKKYGFRQNDCDVFLIRLVFPAAMIYQRSHFYVVRLLGGFQMIEFYSSYDGSWIRASMTLDEQLLTSCWSVSNYVALFKESAIFLFFLTDEDYGMTIRFNAFDNQNAFGYAFQLPEVVQGGYKNARLGECGGEYLYLSYHTAGGVWIWKHNGVSTSVDAWIPLLEISNVRQLCKPVAREHIATVLNAGDPVIPMAFHPDVTVVFLCVKSVIFAYDLNNDSIEKIAEINDHIINPSSLGFTFLPCLHSLAGVKRHIELKKMIRAQKART